VNRPSSSARRIWLSLLAAVILQFGFHNPALGQPAFSKPGYGTIYYGGANMPARRILKFDGTGVTCADDPVLLMSVCTITGTGGGTIDGSGAAGEVTVWADADTLTSESAFSYKSHEGMKFLNFVDEAGRQLQIGVTGNSGVCNGDCDDPGLLCAIHANCTGCSNGCTQIWDKTKPSIFSGNSWSLGLATGNASGTMYFQSYDNMTFYNADATVKRLELHSTGGVPDYATIYGDTYVDDLTGTGTRCVNVSDTGLLGAAACGTVDGSGTAGEVTFWSDTDTVTSDSGFCYDPTENQFFVNRSCVDPGVGGDASGIVVDRNVWVIGDGADSNYYFMAYGADPQWLGYRAQGREATPTIVTDGNRLIHIRGTGYDGAPTNGYWAIGGYMDIVADGNWVADTSSPAKWMLYLTPSGSQTPIKVGEWKPGEFRILSAGTTPSLYLEGSGGDGAISYDSSGTPEFRPNRAWRMVEDLPLHIGGAAGYWSLKYDEAVDDQLLLSTTKTGTASITDPMYEILVGATPTADQQVFGIAKGTQDSNTPLFTVDEDGDVEFAGSLTATDLECAGCVDGDDVHSSIAGAGLQWVAGSPDTLATESTESEFLHPDVIGDALVCGAGTAGQVQLRVGKPMEYCDNSATPAIKYAAYGNSSGDATTVSCASCVALGTETAGDYVDSATADQGLVAAGTEKLNLGLKVCSSGQVLKRTADSKWDCAADATGGGGTGILSASTCMKLSGVNNVYVASGTCADSSESLVLTQVENAITLSDLRCRGSVDPGAGKSVSITGRYGACGSLSTSGTFTCSLTGGSGVPPSCTAGAATMAVGDEECWSLLLQPGGAFTSKMAVNCTLAATG